MTPDGRDQVEPAGELRQAAAQGNGPGVEIAEIDLAYGLPEWDLLPPAEFLRRPRRNEAR
jgi:hypothetical protein